MVKKRFLLLFIILSQVVSAQPAHKKVLSLDSAFVLVQQNSTRLKLSGQKLEAARQAVAVTKNDRLPSVDVNLSGLYLGDATISDRNFSHARRATMPHFGNNFSVEASYLIFAGGAVTNSIAKAGLEVQLAELALKKEQSDMRFLVTGYYLDLYKLQNQRKVFLKNIEQCETLIKEISAKQQEGIALSNDVTRYELLHENLKLALTEIDNSRSIINQQLTIALGLPAETEILPDSAILDMKLIAPGKDELLKTAYQEKTELKSAAVQTAIAETQIRLAKAGYYPSVALIGANVMNGPITVEVPPIDKNLNYWYLGVGIKYNLASVYKKKKDVNAAKTGQTIARYVRQLESEQTEMNVHRCYTQFIETFDQVKTYEKSFQLATENYSIINNRYLNGLSLITEMLDASNMKLNAELQVANGKLNIVYHYYQLLRETGQL